MPVSEHKKAYMKVYREKNREKLLAQGKVAFRRRRSDPVYLEESRGKIRKYHWDNREKLLSYYYARKKDRPEIYRDYFLKNRFGMTRKDFDAILATQNGVCAICRRPSEKTLNVDHDHETGEVRGLLCHNCNLTLGRMKESPENLRAAAEYLEYFRFLRTWRAA